MKSGLEYPRRYYMVGPPLRGAKRPFRVEKITLLAVDKRKLELVSTHTTRAAAITDGIEEDHAAGG